MVLMSNKKHGLVPNLFDNSKNIETVEYEKEVYDNGYIKFYIIEKLYYKVDSKSKIANYSSDTVFLTNDEIDKYGINIDKTKYVVQLENIDYGYKINDKSYSCDYKKIEFVNADDYHLSINFELKDELKSDSLFAKEVILILIEYFRVYIYNKENCIYDACHLTKDDYIKLKERARIISKNYVDMHMRENLKDYSDASKYYQECEKQFNIVFKSMYNQIVNSEKNVKQNFEKVKKIR